jgi:hypothetical protein
MLAANGALSIQVTDLNPGGVFIRADDHSLISSGSLNIDIANNIGTHINDLFPDNFGKLSESFMVVSNNIFLVAGNDGAAVGGATVHCTARIRARVVRLNSKDWMSLALQNTASDS